jgi:hypothetical protein
MRFKKDDFSTNYNLAILRAMAEKLIPGISYLTRIAILQQTDAEIKDEDPSDISDTTRDKLSISDSDKGKTVLEQVMACDDLRNETKRKVDSGYPSIPLDKRLIDNVLQFSRDV